MEKIGPVEKSNFLDAYGWARLKGDKARALSKADIQKIVVDLLEDPNREIKIEGAEQLVEFIKEQLKDNKAPLNWLTNDGLEKIFEVEIPGAKVICAEFNLHEEVLKHLQGQIFVRGNRALLIKPKGAVLVDITKSDQAELNKKFHSRALKAVKKFLKEKMLADTPQQFIDTILDRAMKLVEDNPEKVYIDEKAN